MSIEVTRRFMDHTSVTLTSKTYLRNAAKPLRDAATTLNNFLEGESVA